MKNAWLVVREERHIDPKHWVCLEQADALKIANDVTAYWKKACRPNPKNVDRTLYETQVFHFDAEEAFRVYVQPIQIREPGEVEPQS